MPSPTILIAQNDPEIALGLANDLHLHFARIVVANTPLELSTLLARHRARVAVLDLEMMNLEEVSRLCEGFPDLAVICTHRSPDELMWMDSLRAGAVEFCHPQDVRSILRATRAAAQRPVPAAA